jgi:hypothetical protein
MSMTLVARRNSAEEDILLQEIAEEAEREAEDARLRGMTVDELRQFYWDLCEDANPFLPPNDEDQHALEEFLNLPTISDREDGDD